jgi:hypothetical protein
VRFLTVVALAAVLAGCGGSGKTYRAAVVRRAFTSAGVPLAPPMRFIPSSSATAVSLPSLFDKGDGVSHTLMGNGITIEVFVSAAKARHRFAGTGIGRCPTTVVGRDANVVLTSSRVGLYRRFVSAFTRLRGSPVHIYSQCTARR